jgi:hypothetical protein
MLATSTDGLTVVVSHRCWVTGGQAETFSARFRYVNSWWTASSSEVVGTGVAPSEIPHRDVCQICDRFVGQLIKRQRGDDSGQPR